MSNQIQGILSPWIQEIRLNKIRKYIRGKNVLDAGCGDGALAKKLPSGTFYLGIDRHRDFKNTSREKVNYLQLDLEKKFSLDKKFDTIILTAVVEHLDDPSAVLKNLSRYLNNKGVMIITTPTKFGIRMHRLLSLFRITSREAAHEHTGGIDKQSFRTFQKLLGLRLIKYEKFLFSLNQLVIYRKVERVN